MFDSGVSAEDLINEVMNEVDVAISITKQSLVRELNALERLLYSEIVKEQAEEYIPIQIIVVDEEIIPLPDGSFDL